MGRGGGWTHICRSIRTSNSSVLISFREQSAIKSGIITFSCVTSDKFQILSSVLIIESKMSRKHNLGHFFYSFHSIKITIKLK